jgi:hypothetical protein
MERLGALVRDGRTGAVPEADHARAKERLLTAQQAHSLPIQKTPYWAFAAAAACLLILVVSGVYLRPRSAPIGYVIEGGGDSVYVQTGSQSRTARFAEGSVVRFDPGSRGRIVEVTARGARIAVEQGSAHFQVVHRDGTAWTVEAGALRVEVTGTEFDVAWRGDRVEVAMQSGTVIVRGPLSPDGVPLHTGQRLSADSVRGELSIGELSNDAPVSTAPVIAPAKPSAAQAPSSAPRASAAVESTRSWRARVVDGDYAGVLAEAESRGVDTVIESGSLSDLGALADAARYAARAALAERALTAERTRFPASAEARSAAFLLGRMKESTPSVALSWYEAYLRESPSGSLAPEALGRKMLIIKASSGVAAAKPLAEEYLSKYPNGAFARAAAEIRESP